MKTKNSIIGIFFIACGLGNIKAQTESSITSNSYYLELSAFTYSDSLTIEVDTTSYFRASGISELDISNTRYVNDLPNFAPRVILQEYIS